MSDIILDKDKTRLCYAFLDSGIGGLPYLRQLKTLSPDARCVYVADTERFPYGEKTVDEIISSAVEVTGRIVERFNPRVLVIACNTISVTALDVLRKTFPLSFVGTVPAIKKAGEISRNRIIGFLASERTVSNAYTGKLVGEFAADCRIIPVAASSLIAAIENKLVTASLDEQLEAVRPFISPFVEAGADTVVLACTHFLHMTDVFKKALGPGVTVVDSLDGVAHQALRVYLRNSAAPEVNGEVPPSSGRSLVNADRQDSLFVTGKLPAAKEDKYRFYCGFYGLRCGGVL